MVFEFVILMKTMIYIAASFSNYPRSDNKISRNIKGYRIRLFGPSDHQVYVRYLVDCERPFQIHSNVFHGYIRKLFGAFV